ncbi:MAG: hypothetical protein EBU88_09315 [Acidobacteria bacterium]|nr:hypothetical protein [Acidobacteriota bacterium]
MRLDHLAELGSIGKDQLKLGIQTSGDNGKHSVDEVRQRLSPVLERECQDTDGLRSHLLLSPKMFRTSAYASYVVAIIQIDLRRSHEVTKVQEFRVENGFALSGVV